MSSAPKTRAKPAKRKPRVKLSELITGRDSTSQLYRAVVRYVESKGGSIAVIGGVRVEEWPEERPLNFVLGIRCTGRKPVYEDKK